jgi:nitrite reductase/ring-hydroxylating ferredoxin subunit
MSSTGIFLCSLYEIDDGGSRGFDPKGEGRDTVFVVRQGERVHAWRDSCPHIDGAPMAWRKDAYLSGDRSRIVCSAHGARFDIETGVCTLGPCLGQSLTGVPLDIDGCGAIRLASR